MSWEPREAARLDEMSCRKNSLRVVLQPDGDATLYTDVEGVPPCDEEHRIVSVEFCSLAGGGGNSPHTLRAIKALYDAMLLDNEEDPSGVPPYPFYIADAMKKERPNGPVLFYDKRFYCFSNFSAFAVEWGGHLWMTSEHAYQAAKFEDEEIVQKVFEARSAHDAKIIAHEHESQVRSDWDDIKLAVMERICRAKLEQHPFVQKRLLQTDDREIIEDSPKDAFWGWGPDRKGFNHLGKIWMKLRAELRSKG